MSSPRSPLRSLLINLALFVVGGSLLGLVIYQNSDEIKKVFKNPVDYRYFAIGFVIYMTATMITFVRWHQLVKAQGMVFSLRDAVRLGFIGNLFNLVIPGAVGGDVIKAAFLCRMQPDKKPQAVASMILDRILGLLGLFLLASIAGAVSWSAADGQVRLLIGVVWGAFFAGIAGLAVIFSPALYRPLNRLVENRGKLAALVRELEGIGLAYRERLGLVVGMLGVATLVHSLFVLAFYSTSAALFPTLPTLAQHYLMVPLSLFTTAVPLPFGALGLSEGISGKLFEMVNQHEGAIAMLAFRILQYGSGIISAFVYLANLRQVQTLTKDAALAVVEEAMEETIIDPDFKVKKKSVPCGMLFLAGASVGQGLDNRPFQVTVDDQRIKLVGPRLEASIRKVGYVSGVEGKSLLDKATGSRDLGYGLDIADWIMEPGSDETYRDQLPGDLPYTFNNLVHGKRAKRSIEGPQICTKAGKLSPTLISGTDFVAVKQDFTYRLAAPGKVAGSRWEQTLVFPKDQRYFLSSDKVTVANDGDAPFLRIDMPGHIIHQKGDTFSEVYLSYLGKIPAAEFLQDFAPDEKFLYVRKDGETPRRFIRAYHLRDPKTGQAGPWLAGMTLDPASVSEAWCHQRGYVCLIEEIGGRPIKAGQTFGAAFVVGYFDSIEEMERTYDQYLGHDALIVDEEGWKLARLR
jgi:uncharacterized membrane protein YbhN (UPF0104 family)